MTAPAGLPAGVPGTIANAKPGLHTVAKHVLHLPERCPASHNPAPGSTLTLWNVAGERLVELFSLDRSTAAFFAHPLVRDMELFVPTVAQDAANAAGVEVTAADVRLNGLRQGQRVTVGAVPETH